ncbi:MAG: hypothetical protein R2697_20540 [Ilumatobacteraceae bacterium]
MVGLAISPTLVYFALAREDMTFALASTVFMLSAVEMLRTPPVAPSADRGERGRSVAVKESFYITAFIVVTYLVVAGIAMRTPGTPWRAHPFVVKVSAVGADPWWWALAGFLTVFVLVHGALHRSSRPLARVVRRSRVLARPTRGQPGSQPVGFYAVLLIAHEWPLLLLGSAGAVVAVRRPGPVGLFLVWSAIAHVVIYSWAGERYPWLLVHQVIPLALLSGLAVGRAADRLRDARRVVQVGVASVAFAMVVFSVATTIRTAHVDDTDPRELLVVVQAGPEVKEVAGQLDLLADRIAAGDDRYRSC